MIRCYLVEDNPLICTHLVESLEELSSCVVVGQAAGQSEATRWLAGHAQQWDVLICDLWLADGTGFGVIDQVQDRSAKQKVVVISNYATPFIRERCKAFGVDRIFDKSNELEDFFDAINCMAEAEASTLSDPEAAQRKAMRRS